MHLGIYLEGNWQLGASDFAGVAILTDAQCTEVLESDGDDGACIMASTFTVNASITRLLRVFHAANAWFLDHGCEACHFCRPVKHSIDGGYRMLHDESCPLAGTEPNAQALYDALKGGVLR